MAPSERQGDVGVVAIGRNEGERLARCLRSALRSSTFLVYVDSGSTDDSVALARALGSRIVELDQSIPFSAARARNAGVACLRECFPHISFVQMVDGDCELQEGWIELGHKFLLGANDAAIVCGRRRERDPTASVYNQLCDLEWDSPVGEALSCGGDALIRLSAFLEAGGYDPAFVAGEEPELCVRLRALGWTVQRLDHEMTLHDAAMTRFAQFWRRAKRAGHAYAHGADVHGARPERHNVRQVRSALAWGLIFPTLATAAAAPTYALSLAVYGAVWLAQRARIARAEANRGLARRLARLKATYTLLAKYAQAAGALRYYWSKFRGQQPTLIEYKGAAEASASEDVRA